MAGRPRTMLKRINEMLRLVEVLGEELYNAVPSQELKHSGSVSPLSEAWYRANKSVVNTHVAIDDLRNLVNEKVKQVDRRRSLTLTSQTVIRD